MENKSEIYPTLRLCLRATIAFTRIFTEADFYDAADRHIYVYIHV